MEDAANVSQLNARIPENLKRVFKSAVELHGGKVESVVLDMFRYYLNEKPEPDVKMRRKSFLASFERAAGKNAGEFIEECVIHASRGHRRPATSKPSSSLPSVAAKLVRKA